MPAALAQDTTASLLTSASCLFNMTAFGRALIHIGRLFLLLACCGWAAGDAAGQSKVPETVEVDLVFPRNDTYAPSPFIPIVFAIQNYHASRPLSLDIWYKLVGGPRSNTTLQRGVIRPNTEHPNYSNNATDLHFLYEWTDRLNNTEGNWKLMVELYATNCTRPGRGAAASVHGSLSYTQKYVYFSTRHGAQQPDLVAATMDGACSKTPAVAFNITQVLEVPGHFRDWPLGVCPVLSPEDPTPNACLAEIDDDAASNISYGIQSMECMSLNPKVTCPPGLLGESSAMQLWPFSLRRDVWLVMVLAGLQVLVQ